MNGVKDTPTVAVLGGIMLPLAVLVLVAFNLIAWRVYWPAERHRPEVFHVYTDGWRVVGLAVSKLGVAVVCVSWFWFANHKRTERLAQPCLLGAFAMGAAGFVAFVVGFFV